MKGLHVFLLVAILVFALLPMNAHAACVNLGTAANFALLGGSGVTNSVPGTVIQGDVGSSPTPAVIGFPPGVVVGNLYTASNAITALAQVHLTAAYNAAASQTCTSDLTGQDLGGMTLVAGVYCFSSSAFLTGALTLDAQGDPNACWVFQIGSSLITATGSNVVLKNGASPCNVFWQVGTSATIQTGNNFAGNIMANASITLMGGTLQGRALARNGAVTTSGSESVNSICVPSGPCVSITKDANRPSAAIGNVIVYTYTVCNCGPTPITVDSVVDVPIGTLTAAFTTANGGTGLAVGACRTFTVNHTVTGLDADPLVNVVTVIAHDTTGTATDNATATVDIVPTTPGPCVSIAKVADRTTASAGDTIIYAFTVCNCGTLPVTVDTVIDSRLGDVTAAFTTANGSSSIIPVGTCVVFTVSYVVLTTDPTILTNSVTVTAHVGTVPLTDTTEATVIIVPQFVLQAVPAPGGENTSYQGYNGAGADVISSIAGVFSIVPGVNWANFVSAAQVGIDYTLKNVILCKEHPSIGWCTDVFPSGKICQQGTPNIRLWWPLMYEIPGTTWKLTIIYGTGVLFDDDGPGPHRPAYVHTETWTWQVDATIASIKDVLELFHELPFGLDEVPLVSDEVLYPILQAKLDAIQDALSMDPPDLITAGLILGDFEMEVMDACIGVSPARPNPTGPGTGIAGTVENPACCKLIADAEYVGFQLGILQPRK